MELFYGKPTRYSFEEVLDQYSPKELNSIYTSTVPFLNYWKTTDEAVRSLREALDLPSPPTTLAFECPTPSAGRNKSSMTDLMIWGNGWKVAIEAKYKEVGKKYETVGEWNAERTANKSKVAAHWLELIAPYSEAKLDEKHVSSVPNQFVHRTASACHENPKTAYVVYQIFYDSSSQSKMKQFIDNLRQSVRVLSPKQNLRFAVNTIETAWEELTVSEDKVLQELKQRNICTFGPSDWQWLDR